MARTVGALSDALYKVRERKGLLSAQLREVTAEETALETELHDEMKKQGTTICRGNFATVSISVNVVPQVEDWDKLYFWIRRHNAPHILQRRISVEAYREAVANNRNKSLPGVTEFERTTLNVRKI